MFAISHTTPVKATRQRGFTLVELLTVIAIIAVLATLMLSGLSSAKRRSRVTACTSNLRQISLALNMYLDDQEARPPNFSTLVTSGYLPAPAVLQCPEKNPPTQGIQATVFEAYFDTNITYHPTTYDNPLAWGDASWRALMNEGSSAGLAACQRHGWRRRMAENGAGQMTFILRAQRDGAVVRRFIFPETAAPDFGNVSTTPNASAGPTTFLTSPWQLFADEPPQP
jgi:prepilin-type N-terminal cleavage/methylation domain-containing protein